jgi:hypothetical protein
MDQRKHGARRAAMAKAYRGIVRIWIALVLTSAFAACSSMTEMAKQQDQYNQNKCQQFGLAPGSSAYVQCVSQGANAYAAAQRNQPAPAATGAILIAPAAPAARFLHSG